MISSSSSRYSIIDVSTACNNRYHFCLVMMEMLSQVMMLMMMWDNDGCAPNGLTSEECGV